MTDETNGRFWTLGRISVALQIVLVALTLAVLTTTMLTLVRQTEQANAEAERRQIEVQVRQLETQRILDGLVCVLRILPAERTEGNVSTCFDDRTARRR